MATTLPVRDQQSVTPDGTVLRTLIEGVVIHPTVVHVDDRGSLCEVHNPLWDLHPEPLSHVVRIVIRPGKVKGWSKHLKNVDRTMVMCGEAKVVLYDDRPESPTKGLINELFLGAHNPAMLVIPKAVYHAVQNVGTSEAVLINFPTAPYDYEQPDKYRLPPNNEVIPYRFGDVIGW
jgi:dTDP-4-dehydrorhamnose 3,5-epimerase